MIATKEHLVEYQDFEMAYWTTRTFDDSMYYEIQFTVLFSMPQECIVNKLSAFISIYYKMYIYIK